MAFCALLRGGLHVFWGDDRPTPYIPSAGLRDGEAVRDFELAEEWRHPTAALLIVSTKGRSEVTLDARASRK